MSENKNTDRKLRLVLHPQRDPRGYDHRRRGNNQLQEAEARRSREHKANV